MATSKSPRNFRSWSSIDSLDPNDIQRLFLPDTPGTRSRGRCISTWTFSLVSLMISVFFLVGLFVGFYIREGNNADFGTCDLNQRSDGLTDVDVRKKHEQITYFMSGENIRKITSDIGDSADQVTNSPWDQSTIQYIKTELELLPLDGVDVHEYYTAVTSPDPSTPNRLEVIGRSNRTVLNITLTNDKTKNANIDNVISPHVARSSSGIAEGHLVYGNYGRQLDFLQLENLNITIEGSILLLRRGKVPVFRQVENAASYRASGVLLYDDPSDIGTFYSWVHTPYTAIKPDYHGVIPNIPVQTISGNTAASLLAIYQDGEEVPPTWRGGLNVTYRVSVSSSSNQGELRIKLIVNNTEKTEKVVNVIGRINGDMESDRTIVIGASRTTFPGSVTDIRLGSAHLLEMANAFAYIREKEKWSPRRNILFCSWGGSELTQAGILAHLQQSKHLFPVQTVVYINLDLYISQKSTAFTSLNINSNAALVELVESVLSEVPDPSVNRLSVADNMHLHSNINSVGNLDNRPKLSCMEELGVPIFSATYGMVTGSMENGVPELLDDEQHHYKYHIAAARVMSLLALRIIDDDNLPFNLANSTLALFNGLQKNTATIGSRRIPYNIMAKVAELRDSGKIFQQFVQTNNFNKVPMDKRKINDIKMLFQKLFILQENSRYHTTANMLDRDKDGGLTMFSHIAKVAEVTSDWTNMIVLQNKFLLAVNEALSLLAIS